MFIKRIASNLCNWSGFHSFAESISCFSKAFVLMYHRILPSVREQPYYVQPGMFVSAMSFERQIDFLNKRFRVVFLEEIIERCQQGKNIGGLCAVTFDDGWRDNFSEAFPLLLKYKVPATVFLATGFVGTERLFWPEEICYYLVRFQKNKPDVSNSQSSLIRFTKEIEKSDNLNLENFIDNSIDKLKKCLPSERNEILESLKRLFPSTYFPRQMLNWNEVKEMHASKLIRFGAHTRNHVILDQVSLQIVQNEISKSRHDIEKHLGEGIRIFAYPNGNHTKEVQKLLVNSGFVAAVTTKKGFFSKNTPFLEIPRIGIHDDVSNTIPNFRSRILYKKF